MTSGDLCSALFCAIVTDHRIDLTRKRFSMTVQVTGSAEQKIAVEFEGVRMLGWASDEIDAEERLELSVVGVERTDDGFWQVYFNPWYTAELEFECQSIQTDGHEVVYDGDCFEG
jgi:hypothetical protein